MSFSCLDIRMVLLCHFSVSCLNLLGSGSGLNSENAVVVFVNQFRMNRVRMLVS